jgi:maltokinase-like protein
MMQPVALLYRAEVRPSKLELVAAWLPTRSWYDGPSAPPASAVSKVCSFRFDDPEGEVGVETMLVRVGHGPTLQVPLTYRGAPLSGADKHLIGTAEHSVLGPRWVYDGCGDPVYAGVLAAAILTGGGQAEELVDFDGRLETRSPVMSVRGSGTPSADVPAIRTIDSVDPGDPTLIVAGSVELAVVRVLSAAAEPASLALTGTWPGQPTRCVLATLRSA